MEDGEFTKDDYNTFLQILAPFAPHLTEEIWSQIGNNSSIHTQEWPSFDEKYLITNEVTVAIQIGGKMRGTTITTRDLSDDKMIEFVKTLEIYKKYVGEAIPKKVIIIPNRLINIII
jgi:leucyl-tRNA synthetase